MPITFVDLETTGATPTADRITEIGIVEVSDDGVSEWSTLVNPETRISSFIERLTGISNAMVAGAPTFGSIAEEVLERLQGRLFVAHNARFDYGFLRNEFKRAGRDFRATVLCTVKLSRRLYPQHKRHSLDALIERHGLHLADRHRALGDARLIWQFWQCMRRDHSADEVHSAIAQLTARPSLPPQLDAGLVDELPECHGVYLFYGDGDLPLYIGKANNLSERVQAHFRADHASSKEMALSMLVKRIDWIETGGELGAVLREATLVKQMRPTHNRRLRRNDELCTWRLSLGPEVRRPELTMLADVEVGRDDDLFGLFKSRREADLVMREIADQYGLCHALLGIEKVGAGKPCLSHQLRKCRGACVGVESPAGHSARLLNAFARLKLALWPYPGPVGVREGKWVHVLDAWRHVGSAGSEDELACLLNAPLPPFDADVYRILRKSGALATATLLSRGTCGT